MPVATGGRMIQRTPNDPAWYKGGLYHDDQPFGVPSLWFMSWYDVSVSPNLALFNHVTKHAEDPAVADNQFAVIAPVTHCGYTRATGETIVGGRNVGDARLDYDALIYGWFDYWLKGEQNGFTETTPKVQYYTMGMNQLAGVRDVATQRRRDGDVLFRQRRKREQRVRRRNAHAGGARI